MARWNVVWKWWWWELPRNWILEEDKGEDGTVSEDLSFGQLDEWWNIWSIEDDTRGNEKIDLGHSHTEMPISHLSEEIHLTFPDLRSPSGECGRCMVGLTFGKYH